MNSNWLKLFDEFNETPKNDDKCCSNYDLKIIDGYECCVNCGAVNQDRQEYVYNTYNDHSTYKCSMPYFRVVYFKQKLNMINNVLLYKLNPKIIFFIEKNKNKRIKDIYKLKKIMKKVGLNKYYKYIYSIYFAITNIQLIRISMNEYEKYIKQFKMIEKVFIEKKIRHNLYSYNVIIYFLLKINKNDGYKKLILPLNKTKLKKKVKELTDLCNYSVE
jgi:hypothetical protein